jgi:hypothetical protein
LIAPDILYLIKKAEKRMLDTRKSEDGPLLMLDTGKRLDGPLLMLDTGKR